MRVFLDNTYYDQQAFEIERLNHIISYNGGGKTYLMNALAKGFDAKDKHFLISGNQVNKDEYRIFFIGAEDNLENEESFGSKSFLKPELKLSLSGIDAEVMELCQKYLNQLKESVENKIISDLNIGNISIKFDLDLNSLISKYASVTIEGTALDEVSYTTKRLNYFDMVMKMIAKVQRPTVFFIDEPFLGLSSSSQDKLIKQLKECVQNNPELYLFIACSKERIESFNPIYVKQGSVRNELLYDDEIYQIIAKKENCSFDEAQNYVFGEEFDEYKSKVIEKNNVELNFINGVYSNNEEKDILTCILKDI